MSGFEFRAMQDRLTITERRLAAIERTLTPGKYQTYTPTLTGSVADPNLGTGAVAPSGRYRRIGDDVYAVGDIRFGTAGTAAGTGNYQISLPIESSADPDANTFLKAGVWRVTNGAGNGQSFAGVLVGVSALFMTCRYGATWPTGVDTTVGAAAPWAWAANYRIEFAVQYEAKR